jgi:ATP-binding cassette subfamily B protein
MSELRETVDSLPFGLDTRLGKIHGDGIDLSGGQWQRLAITRAIISPAPVRILDEPTAALDPISESRIYELFGKISKESLTIFISHRLGSTRIADEIIVFDDGKVREQGTYERLMAEKGLYCEMFEQQRSWYQ